MKTLHKNLLITASFFLLMGAGCAQQIDTNSNTTTTDNVNTITTANTNEIVDTDTQIENQNTTTTSEDTSSAAEESGNASEDTLFVNTTSADQVVQCKKFEEVNLVPADFYLSLKEDSTTNVYRFNATTNDRTLIFTTQTQLRNNVTYSPIRDIFAYSTDDGLYLFDPVNQVHTPVITGEATSDRVIDGIASMDWYNNQVPEGVLSVAAESFSPDGSKLLVIMGYYEGAAYGIIDLPKTITNSLENEVIIHSIPTASYTWDDSGDSLTGICGSGYCASQLISVSAVSYEVQSIITPETINNTGLELGFNAADTEDGQIIYSYQLPYQQYENFWRIALIDSASTNQKDIRRERHKYNELVLTDGNSFVYKRPSFDEENVDIWLADLETYQTKRLIHHDNPESYSCRVIDYTKSWLVFLASYRVNNSPNGQQLVIMDTTASEIVYVSPITPLGDYRFIAWAE